MVRESKPKPWMMRGPLRSAQQLAPQLSDSQGICNGSASAVEI